MFENKPGNPDESKSKEYHAYRLNGINGIVAKGLPEIMIGVQLTCCKFLRLLGLRRIQALLKVQGISKYEFIPEQP